MRKKDGAKSKKQAFYSRVLDEAARLELQEAVGIEGLDEEIAVLRLKLRELMVSEPDKLDLQLKAASIIARLITVRYNISKDQKKSLKQAITRVLAEIAVPAGVKAIIK